MKGETLRNRLKNIKINGKKIFLTDLADGLGITLQALYSKLKAQRLDDGFVQQIADVLKVNVDVLLEDKPVLKDEDKELRIAAEKSLQLIEKKLKRENAKNLSDRQIELFTNHQQSLLKIIKALENDSETTE